MHILLTNDDGIGAQGLNAMARALSDAGHRVTVSAPDGERSAVSHMINITRPLCARAVKLDGAEGWAVDGTPVDSARLGLHLCGKDRPDLCISGINRGPNLGGACIYSGTVNAAMEASMAGCPAIAVSIDSFSPRSYQNAADAALRFMDWASEHPLRRGEIYNLNVPADRDVKGIFFTQILAPEFLTDAHYQEFTSNYGTKYYFLDDGANDQYFPPDSDLVKCREGWATVSVLGWDIAVKRVELPKPGDLQL